MPNLLVVGKDIRLLSTRAWVLSRAGAKVIAEIPVKVDDLKEAFSFEVVFVCHTLDNKERALLAEKIHEYWPEARIVQVRDLRDSDVDMTYADEVVSPEPKRLVSAAKILLTHVPAI